MTVLQTVPESRPLAGASCWLGLQRCGVDAVELPVDAPHAAQCEMCALTLRSASLAWGNRLGTGLSGRHGETGRGVESGTWRAGGAMPLQEEF